MGGERRASTGHESGRVWLAAALAAVGVIVSGYLGADQLGLVARVPDPIFGSASSQAVLHSRLSRALPVPDALIGAATYLLELALAIWVAVVERRSSAHPWLRTAYGAVVVGMALAGAGLTAVQAFWVQSFCSLCLLSALVSWVILFVAYSTYAPGFRAALVAILDSLLRARRRHRTV